jgi:hypothetical protein
MTPRHATARRSGRSPLGTDRDDARLRHLLERPAPLERRLLASPT